MAIPDFEKPKEATDNCDFCDIGQGTGPRIEIIGNKGAVSFLSRTDGHPLIIPRKHLISLDDPFQEDEVRKAFDLTTQLYPKVKQAYEGLGATRFKIETNEGGIEHVPHLHFHIRAFTEDRKVVIDEGEARINFAENIRNLFDLS